MARTRRPPLLGTGSIKQAAKLVAVFIGHVAADADDFEDLDHQFPHGAPAQFTVEFGRDQEFIHRRFVIGPGRQQVAEFQSQLRIFRLGGDLLAEVGLVAGIGGAAERARWPVNCRANCRVRDT